jgi:hypothetical protein
VVYFKLTGGKRFFKRALSTTTLKKAAEGKRYSRFFTTVSLYFPYNLGGIKNRYGL